MLTGAGWSDRRSGVLPIPRAWEPAMKNRFLQHGGGSAGSQLEELKRVVSRLKGCGSRTRSAVGAGVHLANTDFIRRFEGIQSFRRSSTAEQERFWLELSDLELGLRSREFGMAVGVGLYRIWLADTLAGRRNLAELLGEELTELSRSS